MYISMCDLIMIGLDIDDWDAAEHASQLEPPTSAFQIVASVRQCRSTLGRPAAQTAGRAWSLR